jgi:hypothetical protein
MTTDGKKVIDIFHMFHTYGVPLDIVVDSVVRSGMVPDWTEFYHQAIDEGWRPTGVIEKLKTVVGDVMGPDWCSEWLLRMKVYLNNCGV